MKQKKSIALVCTSLNQLGGKNNHLKNIYLGLKDEYHVYIVVTSSVECELRSFMESQGVASGDLIMLPRWHKWFCFPIIFSLAQFFKQAQIDIVHTFQIQSDVFGALAAKMAGIKNLYSYYESKIIPDNISPIKKIFYHSINVLVKNNFKKTVVVSHGLSIEIERMQFRPKGTVVVIHLGFEIPVEYRSKNYGFDRLKNQAPCIGTIARLSFEKALERFVNVMPLILKHVPAATFVIMGSGPEGDALKARVCDLGLLDKVAFLPWGENVFLALEQMDIFVMPSIREGCPTALLEACALARPVVASNIEGIRDIVDHKVNGLLVDTKNTYAFADAIVYYIKKPQQAIKMGRKAYKKVATSFSIEKEMSLLKGIYGNKK